MRAPKLTALAALVAAAAFTVPIAASAGASGREHHGCTRQFDRAVHAYVDTTDRRDARGFNALLEGGVTVVFGTGDILYGKPDSAAFIDDFFADPSWTQSFQTLRTYPVGCATAFVLFDSIYTEPNVRKHFLIGVSWTWEHGRWLVTHNQDSELKS